MFSRIINFAEDPAGHGEVSPHEPSLVDGRGIPELSTQGCRARKGRKQTMAHNPKYPHCWPRVSRIIRRLAGGRCEWCRRRCQMWELSVHHTPNGVILTKRYDVPYNCVLILIRLHPLPKVPVGSCPHPVQMLYCVPRLPLLKDAEEESDAQVTLGIHGEDEIPLRERPLGSDRFH